MEFRITGGFAFIENVPDFLKEIRYISSTNDTIIQAMDADKIAGEDHILFAVQKALRSKDNNYSMARDMGIEIMRYASGKRQIEEAFSMGVHEGQMNVVLVVMGEKEDVQHSVWALKSIIEEAPVIEYTSSKRSRILEQFSITDKEILAAGEDMIPSLVLERVALVDVLK
ncbi:KEOPS complex subunit Cgi121 [Methanolobus psychrotolerans]|uniref:KEOPS complex subunit Cgi121 n=1 Tax=Methanolobus psychrotolerans TaxID=1874706 RepID=UPI000B91AD09|nr:KEOPS complex subunit Cgi121 [Methanolobus psychrotolerans]